MKKFLLLAFALMGACSGEIQTSPIKAPVDTTSIPPPRPTVILSAPSVPLAYNAMAQILWTSTGASTCSAPWTSTTSNSGTASLRVTKPSWFAITCTGPGGIVIDSVKIEVLPRILRILVYIPRENDGGYSLDTSFSKLSIQNGPTVDSLSVQGSASLTFSSVTADTVSMTLSGNSQFPRVIARVPQSTFDSWGDTLSIVRIPRTWTVAKGLYADMKVTTSLTLAYTSAPGDDRGFYPRGWVDVYRKDASKGFIYPYLGWGNSSFPAKIWIDSAMSVASSGIVPTPQDSVRLASGIAILDEFLGRKLFQFGYLAQNELGVRAYIGNNTRPGASGNPDSQFRWFSGSYATTITSRFGTESEIRHELFHVLGFGHTCAWPGLMQSGCAWNGPGITYPEPEKDVAFFELWQNINDIRRKTGARIHWGENLAGTQQEARLPVDRVVYPP